MKKDPRQTPADISEFRVINRYELLALICQTGARITVDGRDIPPTEANVLINSPDCNGMLLKDAQLMCRLTDKHIDLVSPEAFDAAAIQFHKTVCPTAMLMWSYG